MSRVIAQSCIKQVVSIPTLYKPIDLKIDDSDSDEFEVSFVVELGHQGSKEDFMLNVLAIATNAILGLKEECEIDDVSFASILEEVKHDASAIIHRNASGEGIYEFSKMYKEGSPRNYHLYISWPKGDRVGKVRLRLYCYRKKEKAE